MNTVEEIVDKIFNSFNYNDHIDRKYKIECSQEILDGVNEDVAEMIKCNQMLDVKIPGQAILKFTQLYKPGVGTLYFSPTLQDGYIITLLP